jgi:hypothetical protein
MSVGAISGAADGAPEFQAKFIPFPVCLPVEPELVWLLAKGEAMTPDQASLALNKLADDFRAVQTGAPCNFPSFIVSPSPFLVFFPHFLRAFGGGWGLTQSP